MCRPMFAALPLLALLAAPALPCPRPVVASELLDEMAAAEIAFYALDDGSFRTHLGAVLAGVDCLAEPVDDTFCARLHRLVGVGAFSDGDSSRAIVSFSSARRIEPDTAVWPQLPADHPMAVLYHGMDPAVCAPVPVSLPGGVELRLDGHAAVEISPCLAAVAQALDPAGTVRATHYAWPGEDLGAWAVARVGTPPAQAPPVDAAIAIGSAPGDPVVPPSGSSSQGPRLAVGAGASGVLAGVAWLVAVNASNRFWNERGAEDDLARLRTTSNTATGVAAGLTVVTGGLGVAAAVTWRR